MSEGDERLTIERVDQLANGWSISSAEGLLAREVQASRKLVADLRAWHHRFMANNEPGQPVPWCAGCNQPWPCPDIRKIDGAGL